MAIADYELYERLKPKLGEAETRALLERFDRFERELPERIRRETATKADLQELKADLQGLREEFLKFKIEILERVHQLEQQIEQRLHTLEQRMEQRFHALEQRSDRLLYIVVILFLIFNSDKVIGLVQAL